MAFAFIFCHCQILCYESPRPITMLVSVRCKTLSEVTPTVLWSFLTNEKYKDNAEEIAGFAG